MPTVPGDFESSWWKESTVYQIYPRSFMDSNGDGIGDLQGINSKVDYLDDLGVDIVWLCPIYESPQADMGYDISDFRAIDDRFGDMGDWEDLLESLHERDIKLIMDQVVNHTSDEHDWFEASRSSKDSPKRDWYHWHPGDEDGNPPNNWEAFMGGSAWEWDERTEEYYLHTYHKKQPDLNWENPDVREAIYDMLHWWLKKGIDGFRMDVINHLSKPDGYPDGRTDYDWIGTDQFFNGPRIHEFCRELYDEVLSHYDVMVVGEAPGIDPEQATTYFEDGMDTMFQFEHMSLDYGQDGRWDSSQWDLRDLKEVFTKWQKELFPKAWNGLYLGNHDQARIVSRFGDDGEHRVKSAKLIGTFLLTLRGTPHVYQGEEIGMTNADFESLEDTHDPDTINHINEMMEAHGKPYEAFRELVNTRSRDNARTPMQWAAGEANAGFTTGEPWIQVNDNYTEINVEDAREDPNSIWHHYRDLLSVRKDNDVLVYGDYELLLPEHRKLFAYRRSLGETQALVVLNWSGDEVTFYHPDTVEDDDSELLVANYEDAATDPTEIDLRPYEAHVYREG